MTKVAADSLPAGQKLRNFNPTCIVHKSRIAFEYCFVLAFRQHGGRGRIFNFIPRERKAQLSIGRGEEETLEALQVKRHQYRARTSAAGVCVRLHPDVPAPSEVPRQARRGAAPRQTPTCMPPPARRRRLHLFLRIPPFFFLLFFCYSVFRVNFGMSFYFFLLMKYRFLAVLTISCMHLTYSRIKLNRTT